MNFWQKLHKPFFALAPMEDITDAAFRQLLAEYGKPDVSWTEFTAADGLVLAPEEGKKKLLRKLLFCEQERPVVAQLFSSKPEHMERAAALAAELGFDGIDINMGCPDRAIEKQGCGSAMIKNPDAAREIIRATKRGAGGIPVSVKTRVGYYSDDEMEEWLTTLLNEDIAALTLHARTRQDKSKVPARWELVARAVELRDALDKETLIIGNGDVVDSADARTKVAETGCDGVMIGRAVIGNPWAFIEREIEPTREERIAALIRHLEIFIEVFKGEGHFPPMKKHMSKYIVGFDGAKELRMQLMNTTSVEESLHILREV